MYLCTMYIPVFSSHPSMESGHNLVVRGSIISLDRLENCQSLGVHLLSSVCMTVLQNPFVLTVLFDDFGVWTPIDLTSFLISFTDC